MRPMIIAAMATNATPQPTAMPMIAAVESPLLVGVVVGEVSVTATVSDVEPTFVVDDTTLTPVGNDRPIATFTGCPGYVDTLE